MKVCSHVLVSVSILHPGLFKKMQLHLYFMCSVGWHDSSSHGAANMWHRQNQRFQTLE